jgi:hypothetical protein
MPRSIRERIRVPFDPFSVQSRAALEYPVMTRCAPLPEDRFGRQPVTITYTDPPPRLVTTRRDALLTDRQVQGLAVRKRKETR